MPKKLITKYAMLNAFLTAFYVVLIAIFLSNTQYLFGKEDIKSALIPMAMLSLLVFSAALCGTLFFGRPLMWYLDGKKKEALQLLGYTMAFFFVVLLIVWIVLFFVSN